MTTTNPLDEFAPYPRRSGDVTAESLARNLTVQAEASRVRAHGATLNSDTREATNRMLDTYGLVKLLRAFHKAAPDAADQAARDLWADWTDGGAVGEWLHHWLLGYGIAPELVQRAAKEAMQQRDAA